MKGIVMKAGKIILGIIVALMIIGAFSDDNNTKSQKAIDNEQSNNQVDQISDYQSTLQKEPVYIDEVYKLQQFTDQLINSLYQAPYPSFERFGQIKKNLEANIKPTCDYFNHLKETTGNVKSEYFDEAQGCSLAVLSMMTVLFDIRDGDEASIQEQRQRLIPIYNNLKNQVDKYRESDEYKQKMKELGFG